MLQKKRDSSPFTALPQTKESAPSSQPVCVLNLLHYSFI